MTAIVIDRRGKKKRTYILRPGYAAKTLLPEGMYLGQDFNGNEAILGEPSPEIWREQK